MNGTIAASGAPGISPSLRTIVLKMASDMRFLGLFEIIFGSIYCITITGALVGVPSIIAGVKLRNAAETFRTYLESADAGSLERALELQGRFFSIHKVLAIAIMIMLALLFIFYAAILMFVLNDAGQTGPSM